MKGQLKGKVHKFGEIDSHGSVFRSDSSIEAFPLDVQLNLFHTNDKTEVIGRATLDVEGDYLVYEAEFFDDARTNEIYEAIRDYPEKMQVSLEAEPVEADTNTDGITFYNKAHYTGLAVVIEGSAPSSSIDVKREKQTDKENQEMTDLKSFNMEQTEELGRIEIERARVALEQDKANLELTQSKATLEREKSAELERGKLNKGAVGTNWLDTDEAVESFGNLLLRESPTSAFKDAWHSLLGQNDEKTKIERQAKDFNKKWKKTLVTRGISGFQAPTGFLEAITTAVQNNSDFWAMLNHTGLDTLQVSPADAPKATGWENNQVNPSTPKNESNVTLAPRQLTPQDVYVYTTIARSTLLLNKDTNAVINFVLQELPKAVIATVEEAIVLGGFDSITSIKAIKGDAWTSTSTPVDVFEALKDIAEKITIDNQIVVAMSKKQYRELKWREANTDKKSDRSLVIPFTATKQSIAEVFGFAKIITPAYMDGKDDIVGFSAGEVMVVGNTTVESFNDFDLPFNRQRYLMEIFMGSSLAGKGRAHVATITPGE